MYQYGPVLGTVPVSVYTSIDRFYYALNKTFNLTGTGDSSWGTAEWGVDLWGSGGQVQQKINMAEGGGQNKGYTIQYKLQAQSSTTQVKLRKFTTQWKYFGLR
jgi:hypothetical protein